MATIARRTVAELRAARDRQFERYERHRWHESRRERYRAPIAALLEALADLGTEPVVRTPVRAVEQHFGVSLADLVAHARYLAGWDD